MNVLKQLRLENKLSQAELAKILNVHQTAVSQWELNKALPDVLTLKKLSEFYSVTIDYLLGHTNDKFPEYDSELLKDYNELDDTDKKMLKEMARRLKERGK